VSSTSSIRSSYLTTVFAVAVTGCASQAPPLPLRSVPELAAVPFFPQTDYDCGPAALATILGAADVAVTPAELIDAVYVEGLRGSLQAELVAATRRYGLLPIPIEPDPASLVEAIAAGRPVLVLQNLGFERAPAWHYAVVVGYDAADQAVILRSGTEQRRRERSRRFVRSWRLADFWGFMAVAPGEIPSGVTADRYVRAIVGAERQLAENERAAAYASAVERWPHNPLVLFTAATHEHTQSNWSAAAALYRRALAVDPEHAAARNNLANVLLEQGCRRAALGEARAALAAAGDTEFHDAIADTVRRIERSPETETGSEPAAAAGRCPAG
jgi:tetratricopeptide (TPR) repeat protein